MGKVRTVLRPPSADGRLLERSARVYRKGRTPEVDDRGRVTELRISPEGPGKTAEHLREIARTFGATGVRQTVVGLQQMRGNQFVARMMQQDNGARRLVAETPPGALASRVPAPVRRVLNARETGASLPARERASFEAALGDELPQVRIHDNAASHEAASSIGAKAFAVGDRVFFGKGQYDPQRAPGRELLAHEVAHAYQQQGASVPAPAALKLSSPSDRHEQQAHRWAEAVVRPGRDRGSNDRGLTDEEVAAREVPEVGRVSTARIQRAISFTTADGATVTNDMGVDETAAGFRFQSVTPTFRWEPDVTIHGVAGDPFADWETAHHQVAKGFWRNVYWGSGADRTRRRYFIDGGLPMRDATAAGNTWYSDWRAQAFAADGDTRSPVLQDSPGSARHPWNNPTPGRAGNSGSFNYGFGFVSTLSARHTPTGTGANAFRHLSHMHWNFGIAGTFDASQPLGSRVNITTRGPINQSPVSSGHDPSLPPMHGGDIVNDNFNHEDT